MIGLRCRLQRSSTGVWRKGTKWRDLNTRFFLCRKEWMSIDDDNEPASLEEVAKFRDPVKTTLVT